MKNYAINSNGQEFPLKLLIPRVMKLSLYNNVYEPDSNCYTVLTNKTLLKENTAAWMSSVAAPKVKKTRLVNSKKKTGSNVSGAAGG